MRIGVIFVRLVFGLVFTALGSFVFGVENGILDIAKAQRAEAVMVATEKLKAASDVVPEAGLSKMAVDVTGPSKLELEASRNLRSLSLEEQILRQNLSSNIEQFGYELFDSMNVSESASLNKGVSEDYLVGPGDSFKIKIFSATDLEYELEVTRDGAVLVPEVGSVQVGGLSFSDAKEIIARSITDLRVGLKTVITLANIRAISVLIVGEVNQPGVLRVNGTASLLDLLLMSGGVKRSGSLRQIQVKRNGIVVAQLDLYELLLKGIDSSNIPLRENDVVFVPPIAGTISIAGEVARPAIYEINGESTLKEILSLSGGLLPTAAKSKTQIERVSSDEDYTLLQVDLRDDPASVGIKAGDLVRVLPIRDQMEGVVLLSGHVNYPGGYQWRDGLSVRELLNEQGFLRQGTDFSVGYIERENRVTKRTEAIFFNLTTALEGDSPVELQNRDHLLIFGTDSNRVDSLAASVQKLNSEATAHSPAHVIDINGAIEFPGRYPLMHGDRLLDVIRNAGGVVSGVDENYLILARTDPKTSHVELIQLSLKTAILDSFGDHNPVIQAQDRIYLFGPSIDRPSLIAEELARLESQTDFGALSGVVEVTGGVRYPGRYPLTPGMRVSDLLDAAGGRKEEAFADFATLSRRSIISGEFSKVEQLKVRLTDRQTLGENIRSILRPYDSLNVHTKPEWVSAPKRVTIGGEVLYPGEYIVDKRETLCGLVHKAGGFTNDAYLFGTVFTRESVRKRQQDALDRIMGQMDDLLAEVHLSPGVNNDEKMPVDRGTTDTFQIIKQLSPEKAVGRLVVDMQAAVKDCRESADIVLENADNIFVPKFQDEVAVVGQVYFPTSHKFRSDRAALDYINLSGGTKELAQREHAYVVQANGEVMTVRSKASTWGWLMDPSNIKVTPGSTVYVPLSVDRINGREFTASWIELFYKLTLSAASVDFLLK